MDQSVYSVYLYLNIAKLVISRTDYQYVDSTINVIIVIFYSKC